MPVNESEPLRIGDPGTVTRCPKCNEVIHGLESENDVSLVYPVEPLWPGGPLVECTWEEPAFRIDGTTFTMRPCGCAIKGADLALITRRAEVAP
jgi:hypothetical protein